jgi:hypothetical protein
MTNEDIRRVAAAAWTATKQAEQPEFAAVTPDYQTRLIGRVESVARFGASEDAFEQAAKAEIEALQASDAQLLATPEIATGENLGETETETASAEAAATAETRTRRGR